jgi:hypothetical protein
MAVSVLPPPVSLPYLDVDSPESSPVSVAELRTHIAALVGESRERAVTLRFIRSARIGEMKYWLWTVRARGTSAYATVLQEPDGSAWIRHHEDARRSPEELLVDDYKSAFEP